MSWLVAALAALVATGVGTLLVIVRQGAQRDRALQDAAAARQGKIVDLDGFSFDLAFMVKALCDLAQSDLAEALLARPPRIDAARLLMRFHHLPLQSQPNVGITRKTVAVPGLTAFVCAVCARSYPGTELIIEREANIPGGASLAGREVYRALCPALHNLPGLADHQIIR